MNHLGAKQDATFFAGVFSFLLVRQHQMGTQVLQGLNLNQTHSVCLGGGGRRGVSQLNAIFRSKIALGVISTPLWGSCSLKLALRFLCIPY